MQLDYWRGQLDRVPGLDLPTDRPRSTLGNGPAGTATIDLPADLADALRSLCRGEGATVFMGLLAGLQALLHRRTGQEDFASARRSPTGTARRSSASSASSSTRWCSAPTSRAARASGRC